MAANLNTPADFMLTKGVKFDMQSNVSDKIDLLPPSAFQLPKEEGLRELADATKEIIQLKLENQKLKETPSVPVYIPASMKESYASEECKHSRPPPQQPPPPQLPPQQLPPPHPPTSHPPPSHESERKYVDELLTRQATEIGDLKNELRTIKCKHMEELTSLERESAVKEKKSLQTIASLEAELRIQEDKYTSQVNHLNSGYEKETADFRDMIQNLKQELTSSVSRSAIQIRELEEQLKHSEEKLSSSTDRLQQELRSREYTIENQEKQILQLKNYIGDSERAPKPAEVWRKEKETLENKLQIAEAERDNLQSNLQLINVRMLSVNEILSLQESEISRSIHDKSDKEKRENLLTRWREKVFSLLVQQKSTEIICKKDEQNWKCKVLGLENELASVTSQKEVLSHSLSDVKAQLDIECNNNRRLQQELTQAQQLALCLDEKLSVNRDNMECSTEFTESVVSSMEEKLNLLTSALGTLKTYGQRISFASGRVEMLQGLFARRDAMLLRQVEDMSKSKTQTEEVENQESVSHLNAELERVIKERDSLASQLKEDSETFNTRVQAAARTYEDEISTLKKTVEELQFVLQEKSQTCIDLDEALEKTRQHLIQSEEISAKLKSNLEGQQEHLDNALAEQRTALQTEMSEETADLKKKLDDARREHTKAVVSRRQLERQCSRDKDRSTEHLKTVEEHYTRQISHLQQQLQALEKDRNLMMATLRQEGLIGKVKAVREEPIKLQETEVSLRHVSELKPQKVPDEPLTSVLEDLESLTNAVLKEDVSSSDSES